MAKVFISYTSKDPAAGRLARLIHDRLAAEGIESFLDLSKIAPGREIDAAIRLVLPEVETLIMVVSASSEDSKWMMAECMYAFEHDIDVIPVLAEAKAVVPFPFNRSNRLDFAARLEEHWPRLIERLGGFRQASSPKAEIQDTTAIQDTAATPDTAANRDPAAREEPGDSPGEDAGSTGPTGPEIRVGRTRINGLYAVIGVVVAAGLAIAASGLWSRRGGESTLPQPASDEPFVPTPALVEIPGGTFMMGSEHGIEAEAPVHEVAIASPFWLGATEVTFHQYQAFAAATGRDRPEDVTAGPADRPVVNVSWNDANAYAQWLSAMTGSSCRLPSEAEWEYAARAGTDTPFALPAPGGGDELSGLANCQDCGASQALSPESNAVVGRQALPVGSFAPNAWGLHDMHGNAWEWVEDCWHETYDGAPGDGSAWLEEDGENCADRVLRGGSWGSVRDLARSAVRNWYAPDYRYDGIGFRVLCSSPIDER